MKLILARHGNTFHTGHPAYYVGSQQDLPLVPFGIEQAQAIGQTLQRQGCHLAAVYTGPLQRMKSTAQHALTALQSRVQAEVDLRLNELDYGLWSGLTSKEVRQKFGDADYEAWERYSRWPKNAQWGESEQAVIERIHDFAQTITQQYAEQDAILVVASNGCLRYFLTLIPGLFEQHIAQQQLKIGTGHICQFHYDHQGWKLDFWNINPLD